VTDNAKPNPIHIKASHVGRFTAWCKAHGYGGVTAAAIAAGKRSKDAAVRKQATFAGNAKKFKHGPKSPKPASGS
jgi:hypothetical protein